LKTKKKKAAALRINHPLICLTCKLKFLVIVSDENKADLQNAKCGLPASIHQIPGVTVKRGVAESVSPSEEKSLTMCTPLHKQGSKCSLRLQRLQT